MSHENCPGVPHECAGALARIDKALDGRVSAAQIAEIRLQFEDCKPCLEAYDLELKVHVTISQSCHEVAPEELQKRIGEALAKVDLSQIEVTDL